MNGIKNEIYGRIWNDLEALMEEHMCHNCDFQGDLCLSSGDYFSPYCDRYQMVENLCQETDKFIDFLSKGLTF